jgi:hypothetical protein
MQEIDKLLPRVRELDRLLSAANLQKAALGRRFWRIIEKSGSGWHEAVPANAYRSIGPHYS